MKKVFLSYVVVGVYFGTVFAVSLLIALLASLVDVKRGDCSVGVTKSFIQQNDSIPSLSKDIPSQKRQQEVFENSKQKLSVKAREKIKKIKGIKANDGCPEFLQFQNGTYWENVRLPSYVRPTRYDIELSIPKFNSELYAGVETITIELDQDTKYIIFHSTSVEIGEGSKLFDKSNNEIEITCGGYYEYNDYYVIISNNTIPKSASPLRLYIQFTGLLFETEIGIFDIQYTDGEEKYVLSSPLLSLYLARNN
jgi:hypothetical protein